MSKRKGVSAEEKRVRMLQLFHEKKDFFQLKELEKLAPKEKGIVAQSVKDLIQNLVDDNLVKTDKIGTSVYFWSFPSDVQITKRNKLNELHETISTMKLKLEKAQSSIVLLQGGRNDSQESKEILETNVRLKNERDSLLTEIKKFSVHDPEEHQRKAAEIEIAKEAANRWTDNIFSVKSWCRDKFSIEENVLDKQFGIPPELDYID